jgi:hypothetical protein
MVRKNQEKNITKILDMLLVASVVKKKTQAKKQPKINDIFHKYTSSILKKYASMSIANDNPESQGFVIKQQELAAAKGSSDHFRVQMLIERAANNNQETSRSSSHAGKVNLNRKAAGKNTVSQKQR